MRITAIEISKLVNGTLLGDQDHIIIGAASLLEAGKDDISFIGNPKYLKLK